jgi:Cof subfamily protein (haloacid dehalogenase superfamily)
MRFKALALDLDGTLLTSRESVSDRNLVALAAARDAGLQIILASARWYQLAERVARQVHAAPPVVACSGAQVRRLDDGRDLLDVRLPDDFTRALYAVCDEERSISTVVLDEHVVVKMDRAPDPSLAPPEMRFAPSLAASAEGAPRIALIQGSAAVERIRRELEPAWGDQVHFIISISSYGKPILTLTAMGAHKGKALAVACEDLGIGVEDVVAFGDSGNDLEMFRVAGASVAMGQSGDDLKSDATYVSTSNDEDGVAVAIERILEHGDLWPRP